MHVWVPAPGGSVLRLHVGRWPNAVPVAAERHVMVEQEREGFNGGRAASGERLRVACMLRTAQRPSDAPPRAAYKPRVPQQWCVEGLQACEEFVQCGNRGLEAFGNVLHVVAGADRGIDLATGGAEEVGARVHVVFDAAKQGQTRFTFLLADGEESVAPCPSNRSAATGVEGAILPVFSLR